MFFRTDTAGCGQVVPGGSGRWGKAVNALEVQEREMSLWARGSLGKGLQWPGQMLTIGDMKREAPRQGLSARNP